MKDLFQSLYLQLKDATGPTRTVVGAGVALVLLIIGAAAFRSMNPSMVFLYGNLDQRMFNKVMGAIANAGVRFETTNPPGPYTIWVAQPDLQMALSAAHSAGALEDAPTGIEVGTGGASSVFMGQAERQQVTRKRMWQEVQRQLEAYEWVARAVCTSSSPSRNMFVDADPGTVSVVLTLYGSGFPDAEQRMSAATTVQNGFGVPAKNVVISDQHGRRIFDGSRDKALEENLAFEEQYNRNKTEIAQRFLDETFGIGLAKVSVSGEFNYEKVEKLDESVSPSKNLLSEELRDTETPVDSPTVTGGPVSTSTIGDGSDAPAAAPSSPATTSEARRQYSPAKNFTYTKHDQPVLMRMAVSLVLDESLAADLDDAQEAIKGALNFNPERDQMHAVTQALPGVERDEKGLPLAPVAALPTEEPISPTLLMMLDHGVEIVAALAFIFLLMRGLKKGNVKIEIKQPGMNLDDLKDEEIDMDSLARRHVEDLLARDPDRVGALLSRWALGEDFYIRSHE